LPYKRQKIPSAMQESVIVPSPLLHFATGHTQNRSSNAEKVSRITKQQRPRSVHTI